jgi:hypothetical protein
MKRSKQISNLNISDHLPPPSRNAQPVLPVPALELNSGIERFGQRFRIQNRPGFPSR